MAKFKLAVAPTFKAKVAIPVHGGETVELSFEFKHRTRDQLADMMKTIEKRKDVDLMLDVLAGWELDDPFGKESIELLCQNFAGAPREIFGTYITEITQAKRGN